MLLKLESWTKFEGQFTSQAYDPVLMLMNMPECVLADAEATMEQLYRGRLAIPGKVEDPVERKMPPCEINATNVDDTEVDNMALRSRGTDLIDKVIATLMVLLEIPKEGGSEFVSACSGASWQTFCYMLFRKGCYLGCAGTISLLMGLAIMWQSTLDGVAIIRQATYMPKIVVGRVVSVLARFWKMYRG